MSVIRGKHNKENPYVQINRHPLRSDKLSFKAKGLWAHCLSHKDDWEFSITHLASISKEGKKAIYSAIDELMREGYAMKMEGTVKNPDGRFSDKIVEYHFFEFPLSAEDRAANEEEFKKSLRERGFGDLRRGDVRKAPVRKNKDKKEQAKEEVPSSCPQDAPASQSPAAVAAPSLKKEVSQEDQRNTQALIERLRVLKPDVKIPVTLKKWHNQMRLLREVDKRSSDQIIRVINWLGGADCLFQVWSPESLRQKFDKIEHRMKNPIKKFNQQIDRSSKDEYGNTLTPEFIRATYGF
jgi:hypothetical protein